MIAPSLDWTGISSRGGLTLRRVGVGTCGQTSAFEFRGHCENAGKREDTTTTVVEDKTDESTQLGAEEERILRMRTGSPSSLEVGKQVR